MTDKDIDKIESFQRMRNNLNARSNALSIEKVNYVRMILGYHREGMNDYTESFFDDEETVNIIKEFTEALNEKDQQKLEMIKAKIKHIKIEF